MTTIETLFQKHQIDHWSWVSLERPLSLEFYKSWLEKGYHGEMAYLKKHLPAKEQPTLLLPQAQSALVMTINYGLHENTLPTPHLKVAAYAQGEDYHFWLQKKLNDLCVDLQNVYPRDHFLGFTDSAPVMERDLAHRAGLGWIGKNTCLIDRRRGSLFFIAEIYSTMAAPKTSPTLSPDHCGTCDRCLTACPTQALEPDKTLNATRCISYWTIESKKIPPVELREKFQDWFFGCDICQTVCPWNIKVRDLAPPKKASDPEALEKDLRWILTNSNKQLLRFFAKTPLARAGGRGLKRNALIVIANLKLRALEPDVRPFLKHKELGELAQWTLDAIHNSPES